MGKRIDRDQFKERMSDLVQKAGSAIRAVEAYGEQYPKLITASDVTIIGAYLNKALADCSRTLNATVSPAKAFNLSDEPSLPIEEDQ